GTLFIFVPPRPSWQESCGQDRQAGRCRDEEAEDGGERTPGPSAHSAGPASPAGAMSTRQQSRREEGDSRRRGQEAAALRDRAHLSQPRRLRQATQFVHKDSADLLPLDSLKRLGTSKDLQPHSVIQRRLVEGNQSRLQAESPGVQALIHGEESERKTSKAEPPSLLVSCKVSQLGKRDLKAPGGDPAPGPPTQVEQLELQLGQETVACSAQVVDDDSPEFCLGLQTLLALKCCIDLEHGVLRLRAPFPELPFLPLCQEPGQ
ncbi:hypothetical protein MC885_013445, partial [Smutsia gigantea]